MGRFILQERVDFYGCERVEALVTGGSNARGDFSGVLEEISSGPATGLLGYGGYE